MQLFFEILFYIIGFIFVLLLLALIRLTYVWEFMRKNENNEKR